MVGLKQIGPANPAIFCCRPPTKWWSQRNRYGANISFWIKKSITVLIQLVAAHWRNVRSNAVSVQVPPRSINESITNILIKRWKTKIHLCVYSVEILYFCFCAELTIIIRVRFWKLYFYSRLLSRPIHLLPIWLISVLRFYAYHKDLSFTILFFFPAVLWNGPGIVENKNSCAGQFFVLSA